MTPKFKIWDVEAKELAEVRYIEFLRGGTCHVGFNGYELIIEAEDDLLVQYTDVDDKQGNEVYDGDIIKFSERTINGGIITHTCQVFRNEKGAWRVEGHPDFDLSYRTRRDLYSIRHSCEIIGNIYENPELLGGK